jgi:shikimate kinase
MKNLVLIGMPGSGKSFIGKKLADKLGMAFIDTDEMVAAAEGKSISEIFAQRGEEYFRSCESRAAENAAEGENTVIATGGGLVLREENVKALKKSGIFIYIDRPVELILRGTDMSGRPLLANDRQRIYSLYEKRAKLYEKYADIRVQNSGSAERTVLMVVAPIRDMEEQS